MDKDAVLKLMDRIERKWPLDPKYGQDQGWACRWSLLKMGLAAQQLAEADSAGGRGAAETVLERHRILRNELRPRERIFWGGKPYRDAVCELWDALQDVLAAHRAA